MNPLTTPNEVADHDVQGVSRIAAGTGIALVTPDTAGQRRGLSAHGLLILLVGLALGSIAAGAVAWHAGQQTESDNRAAVAELTRAVERAAKDRAASPTPVVSPRAKAPAAAAPTAAAPAPRTVQISGHAFQPVKLTVRKGTVVTWSNSDPDGHTVSSKSFGSPLINQGGRFSHKFDKVGTFTYLCGPHPHMTATVVVTA